MLCAKCGFKGNPNLEKTGPHTKATCRKCGSYIKMLNKKELKAQTNSSLKPDNEQIREDLISIRNMIGILISGL